MRLGKKQEVVGKEMVLYEQYILGYLCILASSTRTVGIYPGQAWFPCWSLCFSCHLRALDQPARKIDDGGDYDVYLFGFEAEGSELPGPW